VSGRWGRWIHRWASPPHFYRAARPWSRAFAVLAALAIAVGLYGGLWLAPPDFQQGDGYRIMYMHVPSAWMSLFIFVFLAVCGVIGLVWRVKLAHAMASAAAPIGASFTAITLVTGSLWAKPMWGTFWVWDARLTSELILFFLYLGVIALGRSFENQQTGDRAAAILAIVGAVDVPIIHYSVDWWQTLHQGSIFRGNFLAGHVHVTVAPSMLWPLLVMWFGFMCYFAALVLWRGRSEILLRQLDTGWARQAAGLP
jgi:heme exporter protein C